MSDRQERNERWSDKKIELLIETVGKFHVMYMVKSRGYRGKTQKENAWQCVANEVELPGQSENTEKCYRIAKEQYNF